MLILDNQIHKKKETRTTGQIVFKTCEISALIIFPPLKEKSSFRLSISLKNCLEYLFTFLPCLIKMTSI